jgi:hypothetical protein
MSIASASLVPKIAVNGLQILNPALASVNLATDANGNVISSGGGGGGYRGGVASGITVDQSGNALTNNSYLVIDSANRLVYMYLNISMTGAQLTNQANLSVITFTTTSTPTAGQLPTIRAGYTLPNGIVVRCLCGVASGPAVAQDYILASAGANQLTLYAPSTITGLTGGTSYALNGTIIYPY